jgi:hypothetical protein
MADDMTRIEVGFDGGLIAGFRLPQAEWTTLASAMASGSGFVHVTADDGTEVHVDVSKIAYVKREPRVSKVGF